MKYESMSRFIVQLGITAFWILVIIIFLYAGSFTYLFETKKHINVLVWGQVLDKEFLADFENETGIRVNMSYFENNEELFVKLQSSDRHDYDLVMPSDWAAQLLIQDGLIKKLDRNKITVWDNLYPALCNHYFDPRNEYTIPFYWSLFGLGIDVRYWNNIMPTATWGLVFDEAIMPKRIATVEDPRALILTAALYLFGQLKPLKIDERNQVKQLLIKQKSHVEIYTDSRPEYVLASGTVPVVISLFGDLLKMMRRFDYINFMLPQEGGFAIIDSFALTATTQKDDLVYAFLNYLFQSHIVAQYVDKFDFFPAVKIDVEYDERFIDLTKPTQALFAKINFFKNIVSKEVLNDVLISLKS